MAHENVFSAAALLLFAVLAQVCESGPIRAERLFRREALKRQELNRAFQTEGEYTATALDAFFFFFFGTKTFKPILVITKHKMMNLKMSKICLLKGMSYRKDFTFVQSKAISFANRKLL